MIRWKALLAGIGTIIALGLLAQVVFLFFVTWLTIMMKTHPLVAANKGLIAFAFGVPLFFLVMATGGYLCAYYANNRVALHNILIALFTIGLSLITPVMNGRLGWSSLLFMLTGIAFTLLGGWWWQRRHPQASG